MSANTVQWGSDLPTSRYEMEAAEQRLKLHQSVSEFRSHMREALNVRRLAQQYVVPASAVAAGVGLLFGFGMGGMFTRPH